MKKLMALLLVLLSSAATAHANALFEASFNLQVTPPRELDLAHAFHIEVVADPNVYLAEKVVIPVATVNLLEPKSTLSITPLFISLSMGANGTASDPSGYALGRSGGLSYRLRFTNIQTAGFENIVFGASGSALLLAKADPGDQAWAAYGVSVQILHSDGRFEGDFSSDLIEANNGYSKPVNFDVSTGKVPQGAWFELMLQGYASGNATVPEPSTLCLTGIGALGLAGLAFFRQSR